MDAARSEGGAGEPPEGAEAPARPAAGEGEARRLLLRRNGQLIALLCAVFLASFLLPLLGATQLRFCPFYLVTGLPCAGCGMGRSFCALSAGQLLQAFRFHLFGPVVYLGLLLTLGKLVLELLLGRTLAWPLARWSQPLAALALLALLGAWIGRLAGYWPMP